MRTRIFRLLVCLVLVAALLVQVSPIQAKAAGNNFFYIDPELQLVSDLIGLGISVGTDAAAHNQVIQDAADWLAETGEWLSEGMLKVYKVAAAAGGYRYMVDGNFLQELFEWMFDVEVLSEGGPSFIYDGKSYSMSGTFSGEFAYSPYSVVSDTPFCAFSVVLEYPGQYGNYNPHAFLLFSDNGATYRLNGSSSSRTSYNIGSYSWVGLGSWSTHKNLDAYYASLSGFTDLGVFSYDSATSIGEFVEEFATGSIGSSVSTDKDLTLNHVGAFGSILPEVYTDWFANSTTITDTETGEEKTVVPIGLGQSVEETQGMTQEDIWAGTSSYVYTETDVGTGDDTIVVPESVTLKDILTGILSVPKSVAQAVSGFFTDVVTAVKAIPAAITDFFTIQSDVDALAVSWADFFPFCIPGDIRDLVLVFDAEPEAPHFVFDVDFPYMNEPWHIDLDFSEWDPVALVLRRLELLLFIVGLAMATRNYYIRG